MCEWQVPQAFIPPLHYFQKTVKIASSVFVVHRPWIWIRIVWAFSMDIVYFRFASPQARKNMCFARLRNAMSQSADREISPCSSTLLPVFVCGIAPCVLRMPYAWRSKTCPASYNLCHKSLVPDWYTSLFAKIFIFLERWVVNKVHLSLSGCRNLIWVFFNRREKSDRLETKFIAYFDDIISHFHFRKLILWLFKCNC